METLLRNARDKKDCSGNAMRRKAAQRKRRGRRYNRGDSKGQPFRGIEQRYISITKWGRMIGGRRKITERMEK